MNVGDTLYAISKARLTIAAGKTEDTLKVYPVENITPELVAEIKEHKIAIIKIMREDEEMRQSGIIQVERQVFDLAREHFGTNGKGAPG